MKLRIQVITCMVALSLLLAVPSALAQANKLIGVWKLSEFIGISPNAVKTTEVQPQIAIFTKKHMMVMGVKSFEPRPELPENATDAQRVAAWEPLLAEAAEYEADETTIICKAIVLKDPNVKPGYVMSFEYRFEGDYLIQIFKDTENYPRTNQFILKYSRLE